MDTKDTDFNEFEPIENVKEMIFYLSAASKQMSPAVVWTRNRHCILYTHLTLFDQREKTLFVPVQDNLETSNFEKVISSQNTPEAFFCVSHPTANLFFVTKFLARDAVRLQFSLPSKIFKVQRREHERFQVPLGQSIKIEFQSPQAPETLLRKRIFDVSSGGLSFHIQPAEAAFMGKGVKLKQCSMLIRTKKIQFEAEIFYLAPVKLNSTKEGYKVGAKFTKLEEEDRVHLTLFVTEGNQQRFMKFV